MCDIILEDIGGASCEPVSGLDTVMYIAPKADFATMADPPAFDAEGTLASKVTIATAHTFAEGKGFTKLKVVTETGTINTTMIGEKKRRLFQNELTAQIAGSEASVLGFMRMVKNGDFIVLVEEVGTGNIRQFGSNQFAAEFTALTQAIEGTVEGNNSLTFTVQDKQKWPAPVYTGDITEMPAPTP